MFETIQGQGVKRPDRALECLDIIDDLMEMEDLNPQQVNTQGKIMLNAQFLILGCYMSHMYSSII